MMMRDKIKHVLEQHLQAHIDKHILNVEILLDKGVGVAEHPDIMGTIEKELEEISNYHDKLEVLRKYF
jgi:hypothetical protein